MSYDIKLAKICDNKMVWDDHIVENDFKTVILGLPISSYSLVVRINDFKRSSDYLNEILVREDVSSQVTGSNRTFFVTDGPIYDGLKIGRLATREEDVIVRVKVTDEDVSGQFTGIEDYFFTQARPLMKSNNYDFSTIIEKNDVQIKIRPIVKNENSTRLESYEIQLTGLGGSSLKNYADVLRIYNVTKSYLYTVNYSSSTLTGHLFLNGTTPIDVDDVLEVNYIYEVLLTDSEITDIDSKSGRIQLKTAPLSTDIITISYLYRARVKQLNSLQSQITIKELVSVGQEVRIAYYSKQNDGWYLKKSERVKIEGTQDVVFYRNRNTNRFFVQYENVSNQFTGVEKQFYVKHYPLLPIYQSFETTSGETLNNAVAVTINDVKVPVSSLDSSTGKIVLYQTPKKTDIVLVSYYYQAELEPDRISVDYVVQSIYCDKCSKYSDLLDYSIDKLGGYEKVYDENKLMQDLKKIVRTILGSDPIASWYGTSFDTIIGQKLFIEITKTKIANELVVAFSKIKSSQIQQEAYQTVTDNEFLDLVKNINVQQSVSDPSLFTVNVDVVTQSGRLVSVDEIVQTKG